MFAIKKYADLIFQKRVLAGPPLKFGYVKENKLPLSQLIKYYYKLILGGYRMLLLITFKYRGVATINTAFHYNMDISFLSLGHHILEALKTPPIHTPPPPPPQRTPPSSSHQPPHQCFIGGEFRVDVGTGAYSACPGK